LAPEAASFAKAKRKERTPFTKEEDTNLLIGFGKHGGKWSSIQKDEELGLSHRRSTDLRDRFRNAFPEKYVGAGFKPPPQKKRRRAENSEIISQPPIQNPQIFEFRNETTPHTSDPIAATETTIPTPVPRDQLAAAIVGSQPTAEPFTSSRLPWANPNNATRQQEMEMAIKLRRAMEMSNASEMMGETEIPLDPGLSEVAYQPHGQNHDPEALTGLLDAAVQHGTWKRD
jgi:hypothetical protein